MTGTLSKRELKPFVAVGPDATVMEAIQGMIDNNVSATVILEGEQLRGMFTERDVVTRVVMKKRDPETTRVSEVMTTAVKTIGHEAERRVALKLMLSAHVRHLPVVNGEGKVVAMLSMRHLLRENVAALEQTVWAMVAEGSADGSGG